MTIESYVVTLTKSDTTLSFSLDSTGSSYTVDAVITSYSIHYTKWYDYDDLLCAEYAMERGEFEKAQLFALRSFYKASSLEQYDVIICAQFCLARLKLAEGEISEAVSIMNLLGQKIASFESPILQAFV